MCCPPFYTLPLGGECGAFFINKLSPTSQNCLINVLCCNNVGTQDGVARKSNGLTNRETDTQTDTLTVRQASIRLDWFPVFILSIQGISLDTLCRRSDVTLRGSHASYQPKSKLNLHETERPVYGVNQEPRECA